MSPRIISICCVALFVLNAYGASLGEALDNPALVWRTGGDAPWVSQTAENHDGIDAGQSGLLSDDGESWVEASVTGPGPLSFWWKVSSELGYDQLQFFIGETEYVNISGEVLWEQRTFEIPPGVHVLRWRYDKDSSESSGLDRGWLDQVNYAPPGEFAPDIYEQPRNRTVAAGATVSFSVSGAGLPEPSHQWFHYSAPVPGATNPILTLFGVTASDAGIYTVVLRNSHGSITSAPATLIVTHIGEVLEAPELNWTVGGDGFWFGQSTVTHDGVDALESGAITNLHESWVQTRVNGPGVLAFWWKVSSEVKDNLDFLIEDQVASRLSGDSPWERKVFMLPAGSFTLRWLYSKDDGISLGQDKGWLDEVTYVPNRPPSGLSINLSQPSIYENDSVRITLSFFDPDAYDTHTLGVDWQDGSAATITNLEAGVLSYSTIHRYEDDPGGSAPDVYLIHVTVSDQVGTVTGTTQLTVSNLPPVLGSFSLSSPIFPYDTAVISGTVREIGMHDTVVLYADWGDNTQPASAGYGSGVNLFTLRHMYAVANTNAQITLTALDGDNGIAIFRTNITIRPIPDRPRILSLRKGQSNDSILQIQGSPLATYQIQGCADLVNWLTFASRTASNNGLFQAQEIGGFTSGRRFYRAIWQPQAVTP